MAPALLTRAALPHLRDRRGVVVNVSSTFGHRPTPPGAAHRDPDPGAVRPDRRGHRGDQGRRGPPHPAGSPRHPDDVARWIVTLADPAADWITGQVITVDGGLDLVA